MVLLRCIIKNKRPPRKVAARLFRRVPPNLKIIRRLHPYAILADFTRPACEGSVWLFRQTVYNLPELNKIIFLERLFAASGFAHIRWGVRPRRASLFARGSGRLDGPPQAISGQQKGHIRLRHCTAATGRVPLQCGFGATGHEGSIVEGRTFLEKTPPSTMLPSFPLTPGSSLRRRCCHFHRWCFRACP